MPGAATAAVDGHVRVATALSGANAAAAAAAAAATVKARVTIAEPAAASSPAVATAPRPPLPAEVGRAMLAELSSPPSAAPVEPTAGAVNEEATIVAVPNTHEYEGTLIAVPREQLPTHRLRLTGLLLQRVSTFAKSADIESFELGFDGSGNPVAPDAQVGLRLRVDKTDHLYAITPGGEALVTPPQAYSTRLNDGAALSVDPVPAELAAYAVAVARAQWNFAQGLHEDGEIRLGRLETETAGLQVLQGLHCLRVAREIAPQKADRLGLSGRAATLKLRQGVLEVRLDSASQLAFVLDEQQKLLERLDAAHPTRATTLTPGQYLVMSHYVMRFERATDD